MMNTRWTRSSAIADKPARRV